MITIPAHGGGIAGGGFARKGPKEEEEAGQSNRDCKSNMTNIM